MGGFGMMLAASAIGVRKRPAILVPCKWQVHFLARFRAPFFFFAIIAD
jgi:hypothetical protein